jgi:hypothetical protein
MNSIPAAASAATSVVSACPGRRGIRLCSGHGISMHAGFFREITNGPIQQATLRRADAAGLSAGISNST